jgi:hypothetical protein
MGHAAGLFRPCQTTPLRLKGEEKAECSDHNENCCHHERDLTAAPGGRIRRTLHAPVHAKH